MGFVPIYLHLVYKVLKLPIYFDFSKTHADDLLEKLSVVPFPAFDYRG